jgi:hypothetical protein
LKRELEAVEIFSIIITAAYKNIRTRAQYSHSSLGSAVRKTRSAFLKRCKRSACLEMFVQNRTAPTALEPPLTPIINLQLANCSLGGRVCTSLKRDGRNFMICDKEIDLEYRPAFFKATASSLGWEMSSLCSRTKLILEARACCTVIRASGLHANFDRSSVRPSFVKSDRGFPGEISRRAFTKRNRAKVRSGSNHLPEFKRPSGRGLKLIAAAGTLISASPRFERECRSISTSSSL